ncbi:hypothetical protein [Blastomonas sp. CCH5-A3]|jgi:hypothetical protein|uniref:hypothetical protein n=1 Tax=Blastomonas sp. CCH5-A3 TaxID=1768761 RepID=UPI0008252AC9|nr:hypothetical protein [Blastomonas sp. CCH5-A3]MAF60240.1 hypothetical protein [Blastomonas sp.]|tara:strand:- start:102313 stop:102648 length:336 start_codon:yes stop_codon:yes gene_type:complete
MTATKQTPEARAAKRKMRAAIRQQVMACGVPSDKASEIVDLALHGADRAYDALTAATIVSNDQRVNLNALLIATGLIEERMQSARKLVETMAPALGLTLQSSKIEVGGQPL